MTIHNFCHLPYAEKIQLLQAEGVYVGKQKINGSIILLFQIYSFYVEIQYKEYRKKIASVKVTEHTNVLNVYLLQIDINELTTAYK